jgi:hypothetical protein
MTGSVIAMAILNAGIVTIGTVNGCSVVEKKSSDNCFPSAPELDNEDLDTDFGMQDSSRASSRTSATELIDDVVDVEGVNVNENNEKRTIAAAVVPLDSSGNQPEKNIAVASRHSKKFRWSTITIREYAYALGDNVTVMGPPISLSWQHQDETVYDLLDYEAASVDTRRTQTELKMPSKYRSQILKDSGYSQQVIQEAVKRSNVTRNQRKRTNNTLNLQPLQEAFEKVLRVGTKPLRRKDAHLKVMKRKTV